MLASWISACAVAAGSGGALADEDTNKPPDFDLRTILRIIPTTRPHHECAPAPLRWKAMQTHTFTYAPGRVWLITPESTITGTAVERGVRRPIEQIRIRVEEQTDHGPRVLAWLQHLGSTDVELLRPGDRRLSDVSPALDDSLTPWPIPCGFSISPLDRTIDLNHNGRAEAAFK